MRAAFIGGIPLAVVVTGGFVFGPDLLTDIGETIGHASSAGGILPLAIVGAVISLQIVWAFFIGKRR